MNQEAKFVSLLFHHLYDAIDISKPYYLSLDGIAAKTGKNERNEKIFRDPNVPDLWFNFFGNNEVILIEAKIVKNRKIVIGKNQIKSWKSKGNGNYKPIAWVGCNETVSTFYYWKHDEFSKQLDKIRCKSKYPRINIPENAINFTEIENLAKSIKQLNKRH